MMLEKMLENLNQSYKKLKCLWKTLKKIIRVYRFNLKVQFIIIKIYNVNLKIKKEILKFLCKKQMNVNNQKYPIL